jgi:hypothetical protein
MPRLRVKAGLTLAVAGGIGRLLGGLAREELQRLAQALDRVSAELRELVEEQHPVVHQCSQMSPEFTDGHLKL